MSHSYEPHRLVIQNLSVLETAPAFVSEVEKRVFAAIDEKIRNWVESQDGWEGIFEYLENETSFQPVPWEKDDDGTPCAWYGFDEESDEGFIHRLSPLLGTLPVRYGLWFVVNPIWVTRLSGRGVRAIWENYLAENFAQGKFAESGFELQKDTLFLPIRIDPQLLADGYPDSLNEALAPFDDALKKLEVVHTEIDSMLKAALTFTFKKRG